MKILKVSGSSNVNTVSASIGHFIDDKVELEIRAIGAGAVNQMYKALATVRGHIAAQGKDLLIRPGFSEVTEDGVTKTVMVAYIVIK